MFANIFDTIILIHTFKKTSLHLPPLSGPKNNETKDELLLPLFYQIFCEII